MSKAQIMAKQREILDCQQALINRAKHEVASEFDDRDGACRWHKGSSFTMEEHKKGIKKAMSRYKKDLW